MPSLVTPAGRSRRILEHLRRVYPDLHGRMSEPQLNLFARYVESEFKSQRAADRVRWNRGEPLRSRDTASLWDESPSDPK